MATAKEICEGVPKSCLDRAVSDIHIAQLAKIMTVDWQELAPFLEITPAEEDEIVEQYRGRLQLQKREALRKWKDKGGSKATYRKLIVIFCTQGRVELAEKLKGLLQTSENQSAGSSSTPSSDMIDIFHDYLIDCYSVLPHPSSSQWPILSNECYVDLDLLEVPIGGNQISSAINNLKEQTDKHRRLSLTTLFTTGNSKAKRKVILVEGVAGAGKTTLSWHACKEWAAGRLFKDVSLLIHISLGEPDIHSATKLADLIPHSSEEMRTNVAKVISERRGKGVCFLFEGCDEAPPSLWQSFLYRFVAGTGGRSMVPHAHIILTSRPGIPIQLLNRLTGRVVMQGFNSLDCFVSKCSLSHKDQLLEEIRMKPELDSLCCLPLNAVILVYLYDILGDSLPSTRTGLFDPLVRNFIIRQMQTRVGIEPASIDNFPEDLPDSIQDIFRKLSKLAYKSLLQGKRTVNQQMLTQFGLKSFDNALGFLDVHQKLTMHGPTKQFAFIHLSLQEFLAAFHISQMNEHHQELAVKSVYDQNPLSPVLTFYAGITRLKVQKVQDMVFEVLDGDSSVSNVVKELGITPFNMFRPDINPARDPRRKLLAATNCIYETQCIDLFSHIALPRVRQTVDYLIGQSHLPKKNHEEGPHINLPFSEMFLYPTDCLSIGYFARHASGLTENLIYLSFMFCPLGHLELKALVQEMHKPAVNDTVVLHLFGIYISNEILHTLNRLFSPHSCLCGLEITGKLIENIWLAAKYFVEGFGSKLRSHNNKLGITMCSPEILYYLLLLLRCPSLNVLDLSYSLDFFFNPIVMPLFSEALKCSTLSRLILNYCYIDDNKLMYLAVAVCSKDCVIEILEIDENPYTDNGLKNFLKLMILSGPSVILSVLSVTQLSDENRSLVDWLNELRKSCGCPKLIVDSMSRLLSQNEEYQRIGLEHTLLHMRPDLMFAFRSPHHI